MHRHALIALALAAFGGAASAQSIPFRTSTIVHVSSADGDALPDDYASRTAISIRLLADSVASGEEWTREVAVTLKPDGSIRFDGHAADSDTITRQLEERFARAAAAKTFVPFPFGWSDSLSLVATIEHPAAGMPAATAEHAYFEFQVETVARVKSALAPAYPASLLGSGTTGRVLMQFVVREDGSVDPATIKTLQASRGEFADAARTAIRSARFTPAEIGGKKVAQVVQLPFTFDQR